MLKSHNVVEFDDNEFDVFDGNIRQNVYTIQPATSNHHSNHAVSEDLGFSTDDEQDYILASQQAENSEYPLLNPAGSGENVENQGLIPVVNCRVVSSSDCNGTSNNLIIVPESPPLL